MEIVGPVTSQNTVEKIQFWAFYLTFSLIPIIPKIPKIPRDPEPPIPNPDISNPDTGIAITNWDTLCYVVHLINVLQLTIRKTNKQMASCELGER